jgi:TRAP-type C4-dicarboxylate transport system permease small subunit
VQRTVSRINNFLSAVTGWLMMVMVAVLVADIVWRTAARPLFGMAEMSVFVMMVVIYLGLSRCEEYGDHVRLEFLTDAARGRVRRGMIMLARVLALITVALFFYAVVTDAMFAFQTNESIAGVVNLPIWPTKFVMVVGAALFLLQTFLNLFRSPDQPNEHRAESAGAYE